MATIILARIAGWVEIPVRKTQFGVKLVLQAQTQAANRDEALQRLSAGRLSPILRLVLNGPKTQFLVKEAEVTDKNLSSITGLSRWTKRAEFWEWQAYFSLPSSLSYQYLDQSFLFQEIRRLLPVILAASFGVSVGEVSLANFSRCELKVEYIG